MTRTEINHAFMYKLRVAIFARGWGPNRGASVDNDVLRQQVVLRERNLLQMTEISIRFRRSDQARQGKEGKGKC